LMKPTRATESVRLAAGGNPEAKPPSSVKRKNVGLRECLRPCCRPSRGVHREMLLQADPSEGGLGTSHESSKPTEFAALYRILILEDELRSIHREGQGGPCLTDAAQ
jgi:hypothetical protein